MNKHFKKIALGAAGLGIAALAYVGLKEEPRSVGNYPTVEAMVDSIPTTEFSEDIFENWYATRGDLFKHQGACAKPDRHILVDFNGNMLMYLDNTKNDLGLNTTQETIDATRDSLYQHGYADLVHRTDGANYPFAYSCDHSIYEDGLERVLGHDTNYLLHGTWQDFSVPKTSAISIVDAVQQINEHFDHDLPEDVIKRLLGQLVVESSGRKYAVSDAGAVGMLQLLPSTMDDCGVDKSNYFHRFAQIDCALSELKKTYNTLDGAIDNALPNFSEQTRDELAAWMTTQAYHAGRGNIAKIFGEQGTVAYNLNLQADEFSNYTGKDLGMILMIENFGKFNLGPKAMTYALDSEIIGDQLYE